MYACVPHNERKAIRLGLWVVRFNRVWMFPGFVVDLSRRTCTQQHALMFLSDLQQESCAVRSEGTGTFGSGSGGGVDVWWEGRGGGGESSLFNDQLKTMRWEVKGKRSPLMALEKISSTKHRTMLGHWCHLWILKGKVPDESDRLQ